MARLTDINTRSIRDAVELACGTMGRIFNADDGETPFFLAYASPEPHLSFDGMFSEAHVPGRHLNALLRAEADLGIAIDEAAVEKHAKVLLRTLSGPVALPINRELIDAKPKRFLPHNLRETLWGCWALARYRDSREALDGAARLVEATTEYWKPEAGWDADRLKREHDVDLWRDTPSFIWGLGRALGPLTALAADLGLDSAGALARVVVDKALADCFPPDGAWAVERTVSHIHSLTCTLSGMADFAERMGDELVLERVEKFYNHGLWAMRDELGWCIEGLRVERGGVPDMGEGNNTGDILETALVLGRAGLVEGLHDAERILRAHLLPAQLRDISFIPTPDNPDGVDGLRDVGERLRGAWGFPAPYGHAPSGLTNIMFHLDIVGGVTSSLCKAYANAIRRVDNERIVDLLFDHEAHDLTVRSPYPDGVLQLTSATAAPVRIRIPEWVPSGAVRVDGRPSEPDGGYLSIPAPAPGRAYRIDLPLTEYGLVLHHRTHDIRVRLRGDEVTSMESFGQPLTFFDEFE